MVPHARLAHVSSCHTAMRGCRFSVFTSCMHARNMVWVWDLDEGDALVLDFAPEVKTLKVPRAAITGFHYDQARDVLFTGR